MAAVVLALAVLLSALAHQPEAAPMPHVSECRLCMHCHLTDKAPELKGSNEVDESKLQLVRRQLRAESWADERYEDEGDEDVAEGGGPFDGGARTTISTRSTRTAGGGSAGSSTDGGRAAGDGRAGDGTAGGQEDSWAGDRYDEEHEDDETYEGPFGDGGPGPERTTSAAGSGKSSIKQVKTDAGKGDGAGSSKESSETGDGEGSSKESSDTGDGAGSSKESSESGDGAGSSKESSETGDGAGSKDGSRSGSSRSGKPRAPPRPPKRPGMPPPYDPNTDPAVPVWFRPASYQPPEHAHSAHLPACRECWGCTHNLTLMSSATTFLNTTYMNEKGATTSWIFKTNTNMTPRGEAVVKVYCVPLQKRDNAQTRGCRSARIVEIMKLLMALDKLSVECGFTDLIPRMWLAPVSGVIPGLGYPINWWGLWMEYIEGISLENMLNSGMPRRLPTETILDVLGPKLNKTKVVRAAIFDLLTSQCDRHAQNVFVQESGDIKLIDNEACLQHMWKKCAFDSLLVPTTQKQEIVRLTNHYVLKFPGSENAIHTRGHANPQLLLDYRCYVASAADQKAAQLVGSAQPVTGLLGTNYPPDIKQCLTRIAGMSAEEVHKKFEFPELRVAQNLHTRATDMITKGFEWAAKYGSPANPPPKKYRFQPPCCRINEQMLCAHPWEPTWDLPLGNPMTGREWDKSRQDPGKYEGGDFGDTEAFKEKGVAGL